MKYILVWTIPIQGNMADMKVIDIHGHIRTFDDFDEAQAIADELSKDFECRVVADETV